VTRTADPPRAQADGTSCLELVAMPGDRLQTGLATGDELKRYGPIVLRSEIRTLIGGQHAPAGTVAADAIRLDALLRAQIPWKPVSAVAIGPEAAFGAGLRRDAAAYFDGTFASSQRGEFAGDLGLAAHIATGWKGGIAALEGACGWAWWQAPWGADELSSNGVSVPLDRSGSGIILRFGFLAQF
jgi:hypothetical protein